jgi:hypothetical protein
MHAHAHALVVTGIFAADVIISAVILIARWRADRQREKDEQEQEQPPQHDAEAAERLAA